MADGGIKIKLAVDKERNRVLFADAGSDFVDVILSFLTLPLSAVQLVAGASSPGCLSTLCQGVSCLRESKLLRFDACHDMLLRPRHEEEFKEIWCSGHGKYSFCCHLAVVRSEPSLQVHGSDCMCWQVMARVAQLFDQKQGRWELVEGKRRFVISDDLVIKEASTANTHLLLQGISPGGIDRSFEEIEVCVGWAEVVSMLKASLSSKTVFTDTFLYKETEVRATVKSNNIAFRKSIGQNIDHTSDVETDAWAEFSIKLFYDSHDKKVMYAECGHEFVDLLLSFLVYPVACVIKNFAGTSHLGCSLDNLYNSAVDLDENSLLGQYRKALLNPNISPFNVHSKPSTQKWFCLCRVQYCSRCSWDSTGTATCSLCSPQFVNNGTYVVDDDLLIYQASAMLVMKHWCNRGKERRVLEMDIAVSKQEAIDLLRVALTSKTSLTDVFKCKLEDKCKLSPRLQQNHFQIFVKLHTGKTITLDVVNDDTIAIVKHKINEKAGLQLPAGYRYHLVYGNRLPDSSTIADCNIGKGSTIHFAVYMGGSN